MWTTVGPAFSVLKAGLPSIPKCLPPGWVETGSGGRYIAYERFSRIVLPCRFYFSRALQAVWNNPGGVVK